MADIRCPNCGKDNPDFLDLCQFCQMPLQPDPMLQTGDTPTKKNTGELEGILPAWLKDVRQQGRDSAAEDAIEAATSPQVQKEAAPDLLAGLASQSSSDEDEVPDWLAGLNPVQDKTPSTKPASDNISPSDFFAQFEQDESQPASTSSEPVQAEMPSWVGGETQASDEKDELSDWLSKTSSESSEPLSFDAGVTGSEDWKPPEQEPQEKEPEDLSWLHNLEASSRQSEPATPQTNMNWASNFDAPASGQSSDSEEDLGWLKNLGGMSLPASEEPAPSKAESSQDEDLGWLKNLGSDSGISPDEESPAILPTSTGEDLDWLKNLGGETAPAFDEPASAQPESQQSDLGWLNDFGGTSKPAFDEPVPAQSPSSQDDLDWLKNLGDVNAPAFEESAPVQPESSQDDLSWLNNFGSIPGSALDETPTILPSSSPDELDSLVNLGGTEEKSSTEMPSAQPFAGQDDLDWLKNINEQQNVPPSPASPVSPFMPRRTAPLEGTDDKAIPDWLKSATEGPSMPPPGGASLDWFKAQESADKQPPLSTPEPASAQTNVPSSISNQDVDSMFAVEMPDWLSQQPDTTKESPSQESTTSSTRTGDLAPVDLPSWVQAMRPVEAAIDEVSAAAADQVTEREGPLAGFRGLIPSAPIGSSRRPKAISLKLQATDEQQSNAALLEQIMAGETTAHPIKSSSMVAPQRVLRWVLALVFLVVIGSVVGLGSQSMPIFAPAKVNELSALIATIPDASPVLVVIDYQPSLVGELEAASGPLLDQMALSRHAQFTFLSTSPNGSALMERLMNNTKLSRSVEDSGLGYQIGANYFNIGFLPGDSAGVLEFVEDPVKAMPLIKDEEIEKFSQFTTVVILTDHAESGRVWVEQLEQAKQKDPTLAGQMLVIVSSAQAGPLLEPYVSSGQVDAMISGLSDAAQYEHVNITRPGIARAYWDAFGVGLMMAIAFIALGSLWSLISGIRARRAEAEQG